MFSAFKRSICHLSHNPSSPPSNKALAVLRAALSAPYPPGSSSKSPLNFNLEVIENAPPTSDQIRSILNYLPRVRDIDDPHHIAALISSHPSAPSLPDRPHSPEGLVRLAQKSPLALKWPIVVDWTSGRASAGTLRVKGMGKLRKRKTINQKA
ncbi:hypothetical protein BJV77DRAFT_1013171, partial [Russula vinacea]